MKAKYWYIKERHNPQFKNPYYVALGNISQREAKAYENPLYGDNVLLKFDTVDAYVQRCHKLKIVSKIS